MCINLGYDKLNCKIISENEVINLDGIKFTHPTVYGIDKMLPNKVGIVWKKNLDSQFKPSMPNNVTLNPHICETNCNYGETGDFKYFSINYLFVNQNRTTQTMEWTGVDVEHTCHFASWPDC